MINIGIKTAVELRAEKGGLKIVMVNGLSNINVRNEEKEYRSPNGLRFCDQDDMHIIAVKEWKEF